MITFILISGLFATSLIIVTLGLIADTQSRAAWQRALKDDEVKHG